jgi:hypothetical protein
LKSAKQQAKDLARTQEFFDQLLTTGSLKDPAATKAPASDEQRNQSRPTEEPTSSKVNGVAPVTLDQSQPDTQPVPGLDPPPIKSQKPIPVKLNAGSLTSPKLNRSETERPKSLTSMFSPLKGDQPQQILILVDALAAARKEMGSQSARVKDLEELLQKERIARESAESRALQLEKERQVGPSKVTALVNGVVKGGEPSSAPAGQSTSNGEVVGVDGDKDGDSAHGSGPSGVHQPALTKSSEILQERLEVLVREMDEMKKKMEQYKQRADVAEKDSASSRRSLAEMVDKIRKDDEERVVRQEQKKKLKQQQQKSDTSAPSSNQKEMTSTSESEAYAADLQAVTSSSSLLQKAGVHTGQPIGPSEVAALERAVQMMMAQVQGQAQHRSSQATRHELLVQSAPYASILGVVVLGMGVMAMLNGWQKADR